MITERLKQENKKLVFKFVVFLSIIAAVLTVILLLLKEITNEMIALSALIILCIVIIFTLRISRNLKKFYDYTYKVISLDHKVPYPRSFTRGMPFILIDGKKAYAYKKRIVPSCFIEFQEGKVSYLVKELQEPHMNNEYKLLYLHENKFALISDINNHRYLTNVNNLEAYDQF
ncbi:hypothetical protein [Peloplasma aerotolerans]|uniref:Uncharacterized protein n=1 Tax=Peloplasma aerotolerans TaxID=3044389 RepID=A0AAW6U7M7_9MOLU|nr:hypothetical protein [Mariniplasma sp. M4Ah]MDI6452935.1 hypothetical protein [Mariniplasma sp. M4Ah]